MDAVPEVRTLADFYQPMKQMNQAISLLTLLRRAQEWEDDPDLFPAVLSLRSLLSGPLVNSKTWEQW